MICDHHRNINAKEIPHRAHRIPLEQIPKKFTAKNVDMDMVTHIKCPPMTTEIPPLPYKRNC